MSVDNWHVWTATGAYTTHDGEHIISFECSRCLAKKKVGSPAVLPHGPCKLIQHAEPEFRVQHMTWRDGVLEVTLYATVDADLAGRQYMNWLNRLTNDQPLRLVEATSPRRVEKDGA